MENNGHTFRWNTSATGQQTVKQKRKRRGREANWHLQSEVMKESESDGRATTDGERRVGDAGGDQSPMAHSVAMLKRVNGQEPNLTHLHIPLVFTSSNCVFPPLLSAVPSPLDSTTFPPLTHWSVPYFIFSLWVLTYTPANTNRPWRAIKGKSKESIKAHITHTG